jgi:hypothetical protein
MRPHAPPPKPPLSAHFRSRAEKIVRTDHYMNTLEELFLAELSLEDKEALCALMDKSEAAVMAGALAMEDELSRHSYRDVVGEDTYIDGVHLALSQKLLAESAGHSRLLHRQFALQNAAFDRCKDCSLMKEHNMLRPFAP